MKKFFNHYRSLFILLSLAALFLIPVLGATYLYHHANQFLSHSTNQGTLINPPLALKSLGLSSEKKWQLFYFQKNLCQKECLQHLIMLRQIRLALGKESERISYGLLPFPLKLSDKGYAISDPLGNIILFYPENSPPKAIYDDLKQLLKVSRIG